MCPPFTWDPSSTKQCLILHAHCLWFFSRSPHLASREERALNLEPGCRIANPRLWTMLGKSFKHTLIRKKPGVHLFFHKLHVQPWLVCCHIYQKFWSSSPSQGTYLDCRFNPLLRHCKRQPIDVFVLHWCFSLSLSLKSINILKKYIPRTTMCYTAWDVPRNWRWGTQVNRVSNYLVTSVLKEIGTPAFLLSTRVGRSNSQTL